MPRTAEHAWPLATDYNSAVQNPSACFADSELAAGQPAADMLGLPLTFAGNFANVYKLQCPDGQDWAVKCFTRPVGDLEPRYAAISDHLERNRRKFAVEFRFLEKGIRVKGAWYPILKMRWIEGFTLNEFLREHIDNASLLEQFAALWLRLGNELSESKMAHGDLQHGNVLLVPGSRAAAMVLRLIDYDGMWVPGLDGKPPGEVGHPNYQHPQRLREGGYSAEIDRFAHLVIYTAFRCLMSGGSALWNKHNNDENLLFKESDFREPGASKLWPELLTLSDHHAAALAGHLLLASQNPLDRVPVTAQLLDEGRVTPLNPDQRGLIGKLVPASRPPKPAAPPPVPAPDWLTDAVKQPGSGRFSKLVAAAETLPEVIPLAPIPAVPVPAALQTAAARAAAPRAIAVVDPWAIPEPMTAPPVPVPTVVVVDDTKPSTPPLPPRLPVRPIPRVAPTPAPPLFPVPDWLLGLGLSPDSPIVRFWPFAIGGVLAVPLLLVFMTVVWFFWPAPAGPRPGGPQQPVVRGPTLTVPAQVELRGGHSFDVPLQIDRFEATGELRIEFENLPIQVNWSRETVPPGLGIHTARPRLVAANDVPTGEHLVTIALYHDKAKLAEKPLRLITRQFSAPTLLDVAAIELRQGVTTDVVYRVQRNGNSDPLSLSIEPLPRGVTTQPLNLPPGGDRVGVRLAVAGNAELVVGKIVQVTLRAGGVLAHQTNVALSIQAGNPGVKLTFLQRLPLAPGGRAKLEVRLERRDYQGPVRLAIEKRPEGIAVDSILVPANSDRAEMTVIAAPDMGDDANKLNPVVDVVARIDDRLVGREKLLLLLQARQPVIAPPPVVRIGRLPLARNVSIPTADGLRLKATFYPVTDPKSAFTVILVLDPFGAGQGRKQREWEALATRLHEKGCTVLAFDFRGFGENLANADPLPPAIINPTAPGNAALIKPLQLLLKQNKTPLRTNDQYKGVNFAPAALPWLVQDLVAARLWLDLRHDAEEANTHNLIVIAEGDAVPLSALWLATEARRYKKTGLPAGATPLPYEVRDLHGAVWLVANNSNRLSAHAGFKTTLETLKREKAWPPMLFVHPPASPALARIWQQAFAQDGGTKSANVRVASGWTTLLADPNVTEMIARYLDQLKDGRPLKTWTKRGVESSESTWDLGQSRTSTAKATRKTTPELVPLDNWGFGQLKIQ